MSFLLTGNYQWMYQEIYIFINKNGYTRINKIISMPIKVVSHDFHRRMHFFLLIIRKWNIFHYGDFFFPINSGSSCFSLKNFHSVDNKRTSPTFLFFKAHIYISHFPGTKSELQVVDCWSLFDQNILIGKTIT